MGKETTYIKTDWQVGYDGGFGYVSESPAMSGGAGGAARMARMWANRPFLCVMSFLV